MNIILFDKSEINSPLPKSDPRSQHILKILRQKSNIPFDVGIINGPRGKAHIISEDDKFLHLSFGPDEGTDSPWEEPEPLHPLRLIVGLIRPVHAKRLLRDVTSLGVSAIWFVNTEKGEKSYAKSSLWKNEEYRRYLIEGAEQAFHTCLPEVQVFPNLQSCISNIEKELSGNRTPEDRIALDNYEAAIALSQWKPEWKAYILAIGSERGWSSGERDLLRNTGFTLASLGSRVLKTETACVAGIAVLLGRAGL